MDKFWPFVIYQIFGTTHVNAINIIHKSEQKNWAYNHVKNRATLFIYPETHTFGQATLLEDPGDYIMTDSLFNEVNGCI